MSASRRYLLEIDNLPQLVEELTNATAAQLRRRLGGCECLHGNVRSMTKAQLVGLLVREFLESNEVPNSTEGD